MTHWKIRVRHLYISSGHNFFGHHGAEPGEFEMMEVPFIRCHEGRGIEGDRFFDFKKEYKGQITFFAIETYHELCAALDVWDKAPSVFRRNVITEEANLNALIGQHFEVQGVHFLGMGECTPCYWMDRAFRAGAEDLLKGRGGLRAKILSSGTVKQEIVQQPRGH